MKILFIGDVVGEPGRKVLKQQVPRLRQLHGLDVVIANGENSAGGSGITPAMANEIFAAGVDLITSGDHLWDQKEVIDLLNNEPRFVRPLNYPPGTPGGGSIVLETAKGKVAVVNVQCRTFMNPPLENPFLAMRDEVARLRQETPVILVDCHGETTSEKIAMGRYLDGRVSAVLGTHTHCQTADDQIFPGGTAYLTDAGFCGPSESCLGRELQPIIQRFLTGRPIVFPIAGGPVKLHGAVVEIDETTGRALAITRVAEAWVPPEVPGATVAAERQSPPPA